MVRGSSIEIFEGEHQAGVRQLLDAVVLMGALDPSASKLASELELSVWMRRHGVGRDGLRATLLDLRRAVVEAGGLDAATEPVPLVGRGARTDVLHLVAYLADLINRSASMTGCAPRDIVVEAAARFRGHITRTDEATGVDRAV